MNQNQQNAMLAGAVAALICVLLVLLVFLILWVLFCLTLQRTQTEVRPRNRLIPPGLVWLHLLHLLGFIPLIGVVFGVAASVWDLIMVLKLGGSLQNEFEDRGWRTDGEGSAGRSGSSGRSASWPPCRWGSCSTSWGPTRSARRR